MSKTSSGNTIKIEHYLVGITLGAGASGKVKCKQQNNQSNKQTKSVSKKEMDDEIENHDTDIASRMCVIDMILG